MEETDSGPLALARGTMVPLNRYITETIPLNTRLDRTDANKVWIKRKKKKEKTGVRPQQAECISTVDVVGDQTKWSLHQIQGGAMNAAHAHVCASLLYKEKLLKPTDRPSIHTFNAALLVSLNYEKKNKKTP